MGFDFVHALKAYIILYRFLGICIDDSRVHLLCEVFIFSLFCLFTTLVNWTLFLSWEFQTTRNKCSYFTLVLACCVQFSHGNIVLNLMFSSSSSMEGTLKVFYWNIQFIWTGQRDFISHEILLKGCGTFTKMALFTEIWHQRWVKIKTVLFSSIDFWLCFAIRRQQTSISSWYFFMIILLLFSCRIVW